MKSRPSVLYFFPHSMRETFAEVESGIAPTERMYGLVELRHLGFTVNFSDSRYEGVFGRLCIFLRRYGVFLLDWGALREIFSHDIVIVKDDFSLLTTIATKLLGKKLIYLDAMFNVPRRRWRKWLIGICIRASDAVVAYSRAQISVWACQFDLPASTFTFFPYALDTAFYRKEKSTSVAGTYIFAVGRDMGRDFSTLIDAIRGTDLKLKLVTLPYLLPRHAISNANVEVFERVSYQELFALYAGAVVVVVPLKDAILYPSGIRAVFESALLEKATIVTHTPILEEYLEGEREVIYVRPKDVDQLREVILSLVANEEKRFLIEACAKRRVLEDYGMDTFAARLAHKIESICIN